MFDLESDNFCIPRIPINAIYSNRHFSNLRLPNILEQRNSFDFYIFAFYYLSSRSAINMAYTSYETSDGSGGSNVQKPELAPVVIMHGLFGSKINWNTLAKVIHQRTNRKVFSILH